MLVQSRPVVTKNGDAICRDKPERGSKITRITEPAPVTEWKSDGIIWHNDGGMHMKKVLGSTVTFVFLLVSLLIFFSFLPKLRLNAAMRPYTDAVSGDLPDDLRLTIYYMDPTTLTLIAVTPERMMSYADKIITVQAGELKKHQDLLQSLNPEELTALKKEDIYNVRLYYIFETDSEILLDVAMSFIHDDAVVNGIRVESSDLFYEIIDPFLTDEDRSVLHKEF